MEKKETDVNEISEAAEVSDFEEIVPLKDFEIHRNAHHYVLKSGASISVPTIYLENLKTEGVI